jgi:hypothetical protein
VKTTISGSLTVYTGSVKSLWKPEVAQVLRTAPQAMVGFLHSGGRWNSLVDRLFWTTTELRNARYGKFMDDGSWVSPHHHIAGQIEPFDLENVYSGRAMLVTGVEDANRSFPNVIWGIWHESDDVKTALMNALLLAESRFDTPRIHLVLPWFGQIETLPAPFDTPHVEQWQTALLWTERQMKGIMEATTRMDKPFHLSVLMNKPASKHDVNWLDVFAQKAEELGFDDVMQTSLGGTL